MRRLSVSAAALLALAACVAPSEPPPPRPAPPVPTPTPTPAPPPPPASADWRDGPLTPGTWTYRAEPGGSVASFGTVLTLRCDRARRTVRLSRPAASASPAQVNVRTTSLARTLTLQPTAGELSVELPAQDSLIDALGYSRGRFVMEGGGMPTLVVPAWAEILRIAEDCRG